MRNRKNWLGLGAAAGLTLGAWAAGPVQAAPPTTSLFTTTAIPDPSEALALDTGTQYVFAMTEAEGGDEGGVDTDAVVTASELQCGEDEHDIAVISPDGAILGYVKVSGEAEYMAVDPNRHKLYVPQYNDEGPGAPQCLAVVDINPLIQPSAWAVHYFSIPFTFVDPSTGLDTGFQYDPTGVAVDKSTGIVYIGAKMPEIEDESGETGGEGGEDVERGIGAIMAFDGNSNTFLSKFVSAGDDPESLVFDSRAGKSGRVYTANEDEGTLTITSAVTHGAGGGWDTTAFLADKITTRQVFSAADCPPGTYQPAEADKLAVDERTNTVYMTDDRYRLAAIPDNTDSDLVNMRILKLSPDGSCPTSADPQVYNYANNLALAPIGSRAGLLYVTSENHMVSIVDLSTFTKLKEMSIGDAQGTAGHIDWPVINPNTNRMYISDELRPDVFVYDLRDYIGPNGSPK